MRPCGHRVGAGEDQLDLVRTPRGMLAVIAGAASHRRDDFEGDMNERCK